MSTTDIGKAAEAAVASHIEKHGFKVLEQNYRTPRCEIDIVAQKGMCVYFIEVKYRSSDAQGSGLDYITAKKQKQMYYAAQTWIQEHDWQGEVLLSAAEVDRNFKLAVFIEDIS